MCIFSNGAQLLLKRGRSQFPVGSDQSLLNQQTLQWQQNPFFFLILCCIHPPLSVVLSLDPLTTLLLSRSRLAAAAAVKCPVAAFGASWVLKKERRELESRSFVLSLCCVAKECGGIHLAQFQRCPKSEYRQYGGQALIGANWNNTNNIVQQCDFTSEWVNRLFSAMWKSGKKKSWERTTQVKRNLDLYTQVEEHLCIKNRGYIAKTKPFSCVHSCRNERGYVTKATLKVVRLSLFSRMIA